MEVNHIWPVVGYYDEYETAHFAVFDLTYETFATFVKSIQENIKKPR